MRKMATFSSEDKVKSRLQAALYHNRQRRLKRIEETPPPEEPEED